MEGRILNDGWATGMDEQALAATLGAAGVTMPVPALRALLDGVVAAPLPRHRGAWIDLVAPTADTALRMKLMSLEDAVRETSDAGFRPGPAPAARLEALRAELGRRGLDGFIVPRTDAHQGEFVPAHDERLQWLTGFTGSAGVAVVLLDRAAIFVDGRYTVQVQTQVDTERVETCHLSDLPPTAWIAKALPKGARLGYDPWLQTEAAIARYRRAVRKAGGDLVAVGDNPVDAVWVGQPAPPVSPAVPHDIAYAGEAAAEKRARVGADLAEDGADAAVLTLPDSIAWLLNIRGADVPHTPLALSFAILHADGTVDLFIDPRKLAPGLAEHLGSGVRIEAPEAFPGALEALGAGGRRVVADPDTAAALVFERLAAGGAEILRRTDPCLLPKACKSAVEIAGTKAAHRRDGAALTRFLAWFATEAPKGKLTEIAAADRLEAFRLEDPLLRDLSFATIAGAGSNGAIVHYHATPETDRRIETGMLFLLDSGGQYPDGTTDVTRTMAVGTPTAEMRDRFTRVLKGHIALATACFPVGTTGSQLDVLARRPLWQAGLDYDHGTGHGVGSFLGVHEGPQRISKAGGGQPLRPGMILSNEPGYYKTGCYGIRIENLLTVVAVSEAGAERQMLGFETITLAPIDLALVEPTLLTREETAWLDAYHRTVRESLSPLVDDATRQWLAAATRSVAG